MKKLIFLSIFLVLSLSLNVNADSLEKEGLAADFLAYKDIIISQENIGNYNLSREITRREMGKVTLNLSGKSISTGCEGKYSDLNLSDWGCKYAERGLEYGFFASNEAFFPDNSISKIEALKMIMKGREIQKDTTEDWRKGYVDAAVTAGLLEESFSDYDSIATRGWIFVIAQHAIEYSDDEDIKLIESLLEI